MSKYLHIIFILKCTFNNTKILTIWLTHEIIDKFPPHTALYMDFGYIISLYLLHLYLLHIFKNFVWKLIWLVLKHQRAFAGSSDG